MHTGSLRCWNHLRPLSWKGNRRVQHGTIRRCVRCTLPTSVVSGTIAAASMYCAAMMGLVRTLVWLSNVEAMIAAPRARVTSWLISTEAICVPLAVAYAFLLAHSWQADTLRLILPGSLQEGFSGGFNPQFFPKLSGIMSLFSRGVTAASLWVHLLAINLFSAQTILREGLKHSYAVRHSLTLGLVFGPLGLLSNAATKALCESRRPEGHKRLQQESL